MKENHYEAYLRKRDVESQTKKLKTNKTVRKQINDSNGKRRDEVEDKYIIEESLFQKPTISQTINDNLTIEGAKHHNEKCNSRCFSGNSSEDHKIFNNEITERQHNHMFKHKIPTRPYNDNNNGVNYESYYHNWRYWNIGDKMDRYQRSHRKDNCCKCGSKCKCNNNNKSNIIEPRKYNNKESRLENSIKNQSKSRRAGSRRRENQSNSRRDKSRRHQSRRRDNQNNSRKDEHRRSRKSESRRHQSRRDDNQTNSRRDEHRRHQSRRRDDNQTKSRRDESRRRHRKRESRRDESRRDSRSKSRRQESKGESFDKCNNVNRNNSQDKTRHHRRHHRRKDRSKSSRRHKRSKSRKHEGRRRRRRDKEKQSDLLDETALSLFKSTIEKMPKSQKDLFSHYFHARRPDAWNDLLKLVTGVISDRHLQKLDARADYMKSFTSSRPEYFRRLNNLDDATDGLSKLMAFTWSELEKEVDFCANLETCCDDTSMLNWARQTLGPDWLLSPEVMNKMSEYFTSEMPPDWDENNFSETVHDKMLSSVVSEALY